MELRVRDRAAVDEQRRVIGAPARRLGQPLVQRNYRTGRMATQEWTDEQAQRHVRPAADWRRAGEYEDIRYEVAEGIAKITIDRPEVRNAFRPETIVELSDALE